MDYLGDAWIHAANDALASSEVVPGDDPIFIAQHVDDACAYLISITKSGTSVVDLAGDQPPATALRFRQSWATACSIARGETDAHQAFLLGEVHFSGDIATLLASAPVLNSIASALEPVMAQTTFPVEFSAR